VRDDPLGLRLRLAERPGEPRGVHLVDEAQLHPNGVEPEPQSERDVRIIAHDADVGRSQFEKLDRAVEEARLRVPIAAAYVIGRILLRIREEEP